MAYSVGKMKKENNLVRYLHACETMGGVDNICTDKTGTITKNIMTVKKIYLQEKNLDNISKENVLNSTYSMIGSAFCINTTASPKIVADDQGAILKVDKIGNKSECALLQYAYSLGFNYADVRKKGKILKVFPFSSQKKMMATVYRGKDEKIFVYVKGAP